MRITDSAFLIPLAVSFIALFGVLLTAWIQHRNFQRQVQSAHSLKVAEMRQAWINSLRDALTEFHAYGMTPGLDQVQKREWYAAGTKVELLMNPADPDYPEIQSRMYAFFSAKSLQSKYALNKPYVDISQKILKREWEVLKKELRSASGQKAS